MDSKFLLLGIGLLAGLGLASTGAGDRLEPVETAELLADDDGFAEADGWAAGETVLQRRANGHFYATGQVQGEEIDFLVDTGASVVALTASDARAAGLAWNRSQMRSIGKGANGAVYGVTVVIPELAVGDIVMRNVPAAIIPRGLGTSLLGQSFLSRLDNVLIEGETMVLAE